MLVVFQSKAASDFVMLISHAQELLQIAGKEGQAESGVFTAEQIPAALAALDQYSRDFDQRHPLMQMLRLAAEQNTFVTWQLQK